MPNLGDKFCYTTQDLTSFTTIVKSSYEATKHDTCFKLGFVPAELVSLDNTGCVMRVPGALRNNTSGNYTWVITRETLDTLEQIGDASMTAISAEMWRIKRSMEMLKQLVSHATATTDTVITTPAASTQIPVIHEVVEKKSKKPRQPHQTQDKIQQSLDVEVSQAPVMKAKSVKIEPIPWPEVAAPKGIRVIKTYADGSQILDDGKERWLNADWTQPVKYVCS